MILKIVSVTKRRNDMTGYEKVMSMSLEELAQTGVCPHRFGLEDENICIKIDSLEGCSECLNMALEKELEEE